MGIDRTARIDPEAQIGANVEIGPYVIIRGKVQVGDGTRIEPFAVLEGWVEIGPSCVIGHHAIIGTPPQDVAFQGEESGVIIGEGTCASGVCDGAPGNRRRKGYAHRKVLLHYGVLSHCPQLLCG